MRSDLIVEDHRPLWLRLIVPLAALLVFFGSLELNKLVRPVIDPLVGALPAGPRITASHLLLWTLLPALICLGAWLVLARLEILRRPRIAFNRQSVQVGVLLGLGISAVTALLWGLFGNGYQFELGIWKMAGDLFSNGYEEICYRGLIFGATLYAIRQPVVAALLASAAFGFTHTQYPLEFQIITALVGTVVSLGYVRTGTLVTPWIAHQIADMILDSILRT